MKLKSSFKRTAIGIILFIIALLLSYIFVPGIFGDERITDEQLESLSDQLAEREETYYDAYFPDDKVFADIHAYGAARREGSLMIYADAADGQYIKLNGKAYNVSGIVGPCVLYAKKEGDNIILDKVVYPEDGELFAESLRELFPLRYYIRLLFKNGEHLGMEYSEHKLSDKVYEEWGVEVSEDLLEIDEEKKTYTITRVTNDNPFEIEIIEEGKL